MQHYAMLKSHLDRITSAAQRYREHASRDPEWVVQWTGEFDPELQEIQQIMDQALEVRLDEQERERLLEDFTRPQGGKHEDELLVQKVRLEMLLAQHPHERLRRAWREEATVWLQSDEAPAFGEAPPLFMRWIAQGLFWTASATEDLELVVGVLGPALFFAALGQWLVEHEIIRSARGAAHPFLSGEGAQETLEWLITLRHGARASAQRALLDQEETFEGGEEQEVLDLIDQGYALALGVLVGVASEAMNALDDILLERHRYHGGQHDFGVDHVVRCTLDALTAQSLRDPGTPLSRGMDTFEESIYSWLLATEGHWQSVVELLALHAEQVRPILLDRLLETGKDPGRLFERVRMMHALRQMPRDEALSDAFWSLREDPMAPVRHTVWYELVKTGRGGVREALRERIMSQKDSLEQEEMLFVLASDSSMKAKEMLEELGQEDALKDVDPYVFEDALSEWLRGNKGGGQ